MGNCIYTKNIDKSVLTSGFTIPKGKWELFEKSLGVSLRKGEKKNITIWLGDNQYSAIYTNVNLTGDNARRTVYQIRYSDADGFVSKLRNIFSPNSKDIDAVGGRLEVYAI